MRVMLMAGYPNGTLLVLNYGWHFMAARVGGFCARVGEDPYMSGW